MDGLQRPSKLSSGLWPESYSVGEGGGGGLIITYYENSRHIQWSLFYSKHCMGGGGGGAKKFSRGAQPLAYGGLTITQQNKRL